jgi:hypothetical protein
VSRGLVLVKVLPGCVVYHDRDREGPDPPRAYVEHQIFEVPADEAKALVSDGLVERA